MQMIPRLRVKVKKYKVYLTLTKILPDNRLSVVFILALISAGACNPGSEW